MEIFGSSVNLGAAALIEEIPLSMCRWSMWATLLGSSGIHRLLRARGERHGPKFRPEHLASPAPPDAPI